MTQHLKYCKARKAAISERTTSGQPQQKIFHVIVEGKYYPQYWLHLDVAGNAELEELDQFLRNIWLECCGHLSAFRIRKDSYSSDSEDDFFGMYGIGGMGGVEGDTVAEGEDAADEDGELETEEEVDLEEGQQEEPSVLGTIAALMGVKVEDIPERFKDLYQDLPKEYGMDVPATEVLKPGLKFSYTYDFGSSTDLSLRVVSEREGALRGGDEEDYEPGESERTGTKEVELLARNEAPELVCDRCGAKPATFIISENVWAGDALCKKCALKLRKKEEDLILPVVNSPRVGVCAYGG
ncbi:MAG: hypothetical protein M3Z24_16440 [Chloroflexota bacterium]|nr:hypothetical protein [Chloroflexota bacterium]